MNCSFIGKSPKKISPRILNISIRNTIKKFLKDILIHPYSLLQNEMFCFNIKIQHNYHIIIYCVSFILLHKNFLQT